MIVLIYFSRKDFFAKVIVQGRFVLDVFDPWIPLWFYAIVIYNIVSQKLGTSE